MNTEQKEYQSSSPEITMIEGKQYSGVMMDVKPYWANTQRLAGCLLCDKKSRFATNSEILTSLVQKLHFQDNRVYAITMNSAYELGAMDLGMMLKHDFWLNAYADLINDIKGV